TAATGVQAASNGRTGGIGAVPPIEPCWRIWGAPIGLGWLPPDDGRILSAVIDVDVQQERRHPWVCQNQRAFSGI
ncbi:hypothetical protein, partial [Thiolapillus sp.]|uniref:hypothetical protein n=1 Tax=Thiolapillus sp. TaxID=2017437 RepID=UPI003AF6EC51